MKRIAVLIFALQLLSSNAPAEESVYVEFYEAHDSVFTNASDAVKLAQKLDGEILARNASAHLIWDDYARMDGTYGLRRCTYAGLKPKADVEKLGLELEVRGVQSVWAYYGTKVCPHCSGEGYTSRIVGKTIHPVFGTPMDDVKTEKCANCAGVGFIFADAPKQSKMQATNPSRVEQPPAAPVSKPVEKVEQPVKATAQPVSVETTGSAAGTSYAIEGTVQNNGPVDIRNLVIQVTFQHKDGSEERANVRRFQETVEAGKQKKFRLTYEMSDVTSYSVSATYESLDTPVRATKESSNANAEALKPSPPAASLAASARNYIRLEFLDDAKAKLRELIRRYPDSDEAAWGKDELAKLDKAK